MTADLPPPTPPGLDALVAACPSCFRLHPDGQRCACVIERAHLLAEHTHERRRAATPGWRRPRSWSALPERVCQDAVLAALDVLDLLEADGWRLVAVGQGVHRMPEPVAVEPSRGEVTTALARPFVADPDAVTPPSGAFHVSDVLRSTT